MADLNETANFRHRHDGNVEQSGFPGITVNHGSSRPVIGVGRGLLWSGGSLWIGREGGVAQAHSHHAIQITLALTGTVRLCHDGQAWRDYVGAVVMPHHRHRFDGCGSDTAMIFVEPETIQGQALKARFGSEPVSPLPEDIAMQMARPLHRSFEAQADDATLVSQARGSLALLAGPGPLAQASIRASSARSHGCGHD